jgi:monofunctional biosynthetic peptidoglycan transglycosylase
MTSLLRHPIRTTVRLACDLALAAIVVSVGVVLALRWVAPPTSAFMLAAMRDAATPVDYRWRALADISPQLAVAVIAGEDQRFTQHSGFDLKEIEKAVESGRTGGRIRGASTISQQTAKNLFLWSGRNWLRKGLEVWWTIALEGLLPKRRILEIYVNIAEFAPGTYGAEAAARRFFAKPAADLSAEEAAMLAAVLPSPATYRVDRPGPELWKRQEWILAQMRALGGVSLLLELEPPAR